VDCEALKMRAGCNFYENGHCIPVNLFQLLQNEGPPPPLRFAIEPLKEYEEMKPANLKGAAAAAAIIPAATSIPTRRSRKLRNRPLLASHLLSPPFSSRLKPTTTLRPEGTILRRGRLRSYSQLAKWPFSVVV
jgi:hypothetical protein